MTYHDCTINREISTMYKDFALEAVVWLVPVVVLIGLALMITA